MVVCWAVARWHLKGRCTCVSTVSDAAAHSQWAEVREVERMDCSLVCVSCSRAVIHLAHYVTGSQEQTDECGLMGCNTVRLSYLIIVRRVAYKDEKIHMIAVCRARAQLTQHEFA